MASKGVFQRKGVMPFSAQVRPKMWPPVKAMLGPVRFFGRSAKAIIARRSGRDVRDNLDETLRAQS
jgi:hypothetical protein